MARARRPYSSLTPAERGAITRRARAQGKDPARVHAALKGVDTRARNLYTEAVRHGKQARERTERDVSTGTFQTRARKASSLKARAERETSAPPLTLANLNRYRASDDDYFVDIEGHQEWDGDS